MSKIPNNFLIITVVSSLAFAGVGFYGGMQYQKSQVSSTYGRGFAQGQMGGSTSGLRTTGTASRTGGTANGAGFGRPVSGEITAMDSSSLTIKTQDGSSKIVTYSSSTTVNKTQEAAITDLAVGSQVMVTGTEGNNGTIAASTISVGGLMFTRTDNMAPPTN